ncbi:DUF4328 domain-containing protein [Hymenobacter sp. BRD67]|uniref:DUF4328 domain-containing protein n=1 Tax=Hymenobacter sp. BRD67 TaxID=2675877 RepID=UPI0015653892|nr:DUF4328 domain-containing protein [Hymenobacter sp. BRD67]QKG54175.1 DUF4328 domain-containing protein [Hymenobacter sp. BRD67]
MLRDNQGRAQNARLVFLLLTLATGCLALLSILALTLPDWSGTATSTASAFTTGIYYSYSLLLIGQSVLTVTSYIVLIMWLRRAYYNLHQLPDIHPDYSDGWAAGAWFVPFINFVRPFTIMREVWNGTQRAALGRILERPTILSWWWTIFVLRMIEGRVTAKFGSNGNNITHDDLAVFLADAILACLVAGFTWYVIGRIATFEEQLTYRQQVNQLGQPLPEAIDVGEQADYKLEEGY